MIAKHTNIKVSDKQIKVRWRKGGEIVKTDRYDHAEPLTKFLILEIGSRWHRNQSLGTGRR
jgi:hypothetical protein